MMVIQRSATFLHGFDQALKVPKSALNVADELFAHLMSGTSMICIITMSNLAVKNIGGMVKEFCPGFYHLLQYLKASATL